MSCLSVAFNHVVSFFQEVNEFVDFMKLDATEVTFYKHIGRQRPYHGKRFRTVHNVDLTNLSRIVYIFKPVLSNTIAH